MARVRPKGSASYYLDCFVQGETMVRAQAIEHLKEAFALVADSLAAAGYQERVRNAYGLLDANEPGVGRLSLSGDKRLCRDYNTGCRR